MVAPTPRKRKSGPLSTLWTTWEKVLHHNEHRIVVIDADPGTKWTAAALTAQAEELSRSLTSFSRGTRIGFCLPNGAHWMAFFLALQKLGLAAMPLDSALPETTGLQLAQDLGCHAFYFNGQLHAFERGAKITGGVCCIKVTSGTGGGLPKTVSCRAEHLLADGTNIVRTMGIRPGDRNLAVIPLGHSYGLGNFVIPLVLQGTSIVCAARFVPRQLVEWIGRHRVTVFPSVPAIYRALASMPGEGRLDPLRLAISAGAPLTAEIATAFYEKYRIKIHNFYGSSETGGISYDRGGTATLKGRSVGKPLTGVTVTAERGVIHVASKAVAKPSGSWKMSDHGDWNAYGELVLLGRTGREINLGGKKVHPSEIERALRTITGVSDALAWATNNVDREILHVAVETALSSPTIQRALSAKLPEWKLPKHYFVTLELPRTARGKINVAAVRAEYESKPKD